MTDNCQMLIDFNSPKCSSLGQFVGRNPLIPCPLQSETVITDNNPFDLIAQVVENKVYENDPFDIIFQTATCHRDEYKPCRSLCDSETNVWSEVSRKTNEKDLKTMKKEVNLKEKETEIKLLLNGSTMNSLGKTTGVPLGDAETPVDSAVKVALDIGNEDSIKQVIAKRVNSCIQKALNSSLSQTDLRSTNLIMTPKFERRSLSASNLSNILKSEPIQSFITSPLPVNKVGEICLNNPLPQLHARSSSFSSRPRRSVLTTFTSSNSSSGFLASKIFTSPSDYETNLDDSVFLDVTKEINQEANKLARTFKKLSESFCESDGRRSETDDDLMSVEPPWDDLNISSTEEDEDGLPYLKLYHVPRQRKVKKISMESDALIRYKKKYRRSLESSACELVLENVKEAQKKQTCSEGSVNEKIKEPDVEVCQVLVPDCQNLKLKPKKQPSDLLKKGPLKAIVPIQKMTRKIAEKFSSPLKISTNLLSGAKTVTKPKEPSIPKKDNSFLSSSPVASSTPQKTIELMNSKPTERVKFQNLSSTPKRLSRYERQSTVCSKRSSSASSNLRNASAKALETQTSVNSNKSGSKQTKGLSRPQTAPSPTTNSRALNDLVPTGPHNLKKIQNKFVPKFKKVGVAHQDKENQIIRN